MEHRARQIPYSVVANIDMAELPGSVFLFRREEMCAKLLTMPNHHHHHLRAARRYACLRYSSIEDLRHRQFEPETLQCL